MKSNKIIFIAIVFIFSNSCTQDTRSQKAGNFDLNKDLLLAHYDCKTDLDDLQSAAALATLLSDIRFSKINYHAVAGTYGIQEGSGQDDLLEITVDHIWKAHYLEEI